MKTTLALLCDAANVGPDNKINILGVFSTLSAKRFPVVHPTLTIVLGLHGDAIEAGTHSLSARLLNADGLDSFPAMSIPIRIPAEGGEFLSMTTLASLTLPAAGDYCFEISAGPEFLASIPLKARPMKSDRPERQKK